MFNNRKMKNILNELNSNPINPDNRTLVEELVKELMGNVVSGVNYELVNSMQDLIASFKKMRFVEYKGSLYLIDTSVEEYIYYLIDNNKLYTLNNYLRLNNSYIEIRNNGINVTYNFQRPNHLNRYEQKKTCFLETEMFYNDEGKEYYRIQKLDSYDDAYVQYYFVTDYRRINDEQVLVSGKGHIDSVNGLNEFDYTEQPYTINYSGTNLDIDVRDFGHEPIEKEMIRGKSKK